MKIEGPLKDARYLVHEEEGSLSTPKQDREVQSHGQVKNKTDILKRITLSTLNEHSKALRN